EDGRIIVLRSGALTLRTADVFDAGLYHCVGTNDEDADALTFRITVVDPHVEHNSVNGAPLSTAVGSTLHLPCISTAAPDAAITWVVPEHTILHQSVGNKRLFDNGTLRIEGVTEQDGGYFQCIAANPYGVDLLVFQVLVRQDETTPKKKLGAVGEWEEGDGSGNALLGPAVAQAHPSATPTTLTAHPESAASASSSQATPSAYQRNSHRKISRRPYGNKTGRRLRGHRRQFVSSGRRADPQRWAALLEKTKRNSTLTDKQAEVATEPPIQVQKFSEVPGDEEETSGDLGSPEEEFMMPVTERAPVPALGRAMERVITAGPEGTVSHTPARTTSLLVTESVTPPLSPFPQSVSPGSRSQTYPKPTDSQERSDFSQISPKGVEQSTVSSGANGTSTLFPARQRLVYSGQSNNQHLKSAPITPITEATDTSKVVAPQNTAGKIHVNTESIDKVSTNTDHQISVVTVSAPRPELGFGAIYSHTAQEGGTPKPPLALTITAHQKIRVIQDVPTHTPQLQQQYGRQRKIAGRRRISRPGHVPSMKEHQYNFGRPGSARGSTDVGASVQLNMKYVSNIPTLNNLSSFINSFSPEAPLSSPSTMNMPLEHPVGTHQNTMFLKENKHSARQKAATTVMSVTTKDTATTCSPTKLLGLKPTVTPLITPQSNTRITKSKIFRVGGRRGQRRKRPPKASAPQHKAAAHSTAATPPVSTATPVMTALTSPAVSPSLAPAKPLPGSISTVSMTEMPALWIPDTPEPSQHTPMADTRTLVALVTQRHTQSVTSLPSSPTTQSPTMALQATPVTPRNTQLTTAPPVSPTQTPTMALQIPPWLDEPPGVVSAQPAAVSATSGSAPAQHSRITDTAGGQSYLKTGEGVISENQAAQPTFPPRTVSSAPAAVTHTSVPSTQPPPALP
ncbi:IGS10 protein, partial [Formicarius rufipectus]|nr:IGS10 protein [Formicarius rufipectus]